MPEPKTKATKASVPAFLNAIGDDQVRKDCKQISKMLQDATKSRPTMWGTAIVGYGLKTIAYADGRTADWPVIGFSPRKQNIVLYVGRGVKKHTALLKALGSHKISGGCLHVKRLSDVDVPTLAKLLKACVKT